MVASGLVGLLMARARLPVLARSPARRHHRCRRAPAVLGGAISDAASISERLADVNQAAATLFDDVIVKRGRTEETIGFLVVVGAIAWTTGQFALYNLARRGIVAPGIVAIGTLVLVIALAPTVTEGALYGHLVVLTGLALLLVLRANLAHQQAGWRRRHIVGGRGVEQLFLRGGALVCAVALGRRLAARRERGRGAAPGRVRLGGPAPGGPRRGHRFALRRRRARAPGPPTGSYTDTAPITDSWIARTTIVFTWRSPYDRAAVLAGRGLQPVRGPGVDARPAEHRRARCAGGRGSAGRQRGRGERRRGGHARRDLRARQPRARAATRCCRPATPLSVDRDARAARRTGRPARPDRPPDQLDLEEAATSPVARCPPAGDDGLTQSRLAAAGYDYGAAWPRSYTEIVPGTLSAEASLAGGADRQRGPRPRPAVRRRRCGWRHSSRAWASTRRMAGTSSTTRT